MRRQPARQPRTLMLRVTCPKCRSQPAVQVFEEEVERYRLEDPDKPVITVQCQRINCRHIYEVTAKAFQEAT